MLTKKSPEIIELRQKIEEYRCDEHIDKLLPEALKLHTMAMREGSQDLRDLAHCILGDAYLQNYDYHNAMYYIMAGIKGLEQTDEYLLISRCYNEIGIIYENKSYVIAAEEAYMRAIEIAREHRLYYEEAIICSNFSSLCASIGCVQEALEYAFCAIDCVEKVEWDGHNKSYFLAEQYAFIVGQYLKLHIQAQADEYLRKLQECIDETPRIADFFDVNIAFLYYYHYLDDEAKETEYRNRCIELFKVCQDHLLFFDEIIELFRFLLDHEELDILQGLFSYIDNLSEREAVFNLCRQLEEIRISMYEKLGDKDRMNQCAYTYYQLIRQTDEENAVTFRNWIRLQSELNKQRTQNIFLTAQAENDSLTGIANRYKLNETVEQLFTMADTEGKSLGAEMMDVDAFKDINDTYGHSMGDEVLKGIGDILQGISSDTVFVARYGGDEFVICYYDMTDEEILCCARLIREEVACLSQRLGIAITVSQGIVNHVPRPHNRTWDYMNAADVALYYVKNSGKDGVRLVHRAGEV